jgi:nitronate monooxygenase
MGVAVSSWRLARAVSSRGQLGVVSGTALDVVLARRLQLGDPKRDLRRAIAAFPDQALAERILVAYFVDGGKDPDRAFKSAPVFRADPVRRSLDLAILGGFVETYLAKEGHEGVVGINFLEKVQLPTPATLYGALLAGVDYVLVGAGIPRDIPRLIDGLIVHKEISLPLHVTDLPDADPEAPPTEKAAQVFDPRAAVDLELEPLRRPKFLAIIASSTLALSLTKRSTGVDGFVIEGPTAGGHNAPPRGKMIIEGGEPVYGPRDVVDLAKIREIGLPFWLAGGFGTPDRLREALAEGAAGIQAGTVFAFCDESGITPELRGRVLHQIKAGTIEVFTDAQASPTGFPFKVAQIEGTLAEPQVFADRKPRCDLGYLRELYRQEDGSIGYRCPAEPVDDFLRKGGKIEETYGRKCVCNGLFATVGLAQKHGEVFEPPLITAGDDLEQLARMVPDGRDSYPVADLISYLLG